MPSKIQSLLDKKISRKDFLRLAAVTIASLFGVVGVITELFSHAATPYASSEAESGVESGDATTVADTTASDNKAVTFDTVSSGLPDMIVESISWTPTSPTAGQNVTFTAVVKNQGTGATPTGIVTGVAFHLTSTTGTEVAYSDTYSTSIAAGQSVTLTSDSGQTWSAPSGSSTIVAWVNDTARYAESNTANNTLTAVLTVASTGMLVGVSMGSYPSTLGATQFQAMKSDGFNMTRHECSWNADNSVNTGAQVSLNAGLDVLMILDAPNQTIPSTSSFVSFCQAMVTYWMPRGIHKYEILNEPNYYGNWDLSGQTVNPAAYAALLKACYAAIKAIDPSALVMSGGVSTFSDGDGASLGNGAYSQYLLPNTYISLVYEALGGSSKGAFDAIAAHPYTAPAPILADSGNWGYFFGTTGTTVRNSMIANGDSDKPIWITEMGWPTTQVDDATQASYLSAALTAAQGFGYVPQFLVFNWSDDTDGDWGMNTSDYVAKPSLTTAMNFIKNGG